MKYFFQVLGRMGPIGWIGLAIALVGLPFPIIVAPYISIPIFIGIGLTLWYLLLKPMVRDARLNDIGVEAMATVLGMQENGSSLQVGGALPKAGVAVLLEVHPNGRPPFQARVNTYVSAFEIGRLATGSTVHVKYDPGDTSQVVILDMTAPLDSYRA